jgi:hypothetical protein
MVSLTQWPLPLRAAATVPHFAVGVKDPGPRFTKKSNADRTGDRPSEDAFRLGRHRPSRTSRHLDLSEC